MTQLPQAVSEAWENREGPIVFVTVDSTGTPNAIYATCVNKHSEDILVVADNYFNKTRANAQTGCKGTILFMTSKGKAYQVKGSVDYLTEGEIYDAMKKWNPETHPGHAAAALRVETVYSGGAQLA